MKFILGKKQEMTQVFKADGTVVPVTRIVAGPCVVTQVKTSDKDNVSAVQIGFDKQKKYLANKPKLGHLKDLRVDNDENATVRFLRDVRVSDHGLNVGDLFTAKIFIPGEKVTVVGKSKGRGFQGVVKRHGFHGQKATHGIKDQERMPGSLGAGGVQRVFKGMRMAGHMGDARITVANLEIIEVNPEKNEILIKGAVPGARGGLLLITSKAGQIEIEPKA